MEFSKSQLGIAMGGYFTILGILVAHFLSSFTQTRKEKKREHNLLRAIVCELTSLKRRFDEASSKELNPEKKNIYPTLVKVDQTI